MEAKPAEQEAKAEPPPRTTPARPRAARRLPPEARRAQLIETAIRVFAEHGIGHANHSQIALHAGVSLPSVFAYFPTHEDLTLAVLQEVSRFMLQELIEATLRNTGSVQDSIKNTLLSFADMIDDPKNRVYATVWFDWSTAIREKTWPLYQEHHAKVLKSFEATILRGKASGEIPPGIQAKDAAWVLVGVGHIIAQMKFSGETRRRIARTVTQLIRSYFQAA